MIQGIRILALALLALAVSACSVPSVRQQIEQGMPSAKRSVPVARAPVSESPIVHPLADDGALGSSIKVRPLDVPSTSIQVAPPPMPTAPVKPIIERAPITQLPTSPESMQARPDLVEPAIQLALAAPPASGSAAVKALAARADEQMRANDLIGAAATLERALRIEPRNASLWSLLAEVRLRQGDMVQAEQLALKSNGLAGNNEGLKARNNRIIAKSRRR